MHPDLPSVRPGDAFRSARPLEWPKVAVRLGLDGFTLAITAAVFVVYNSEFLHNAMEYDEGFFVWCGWSLLKGLVPYRDFIEFKPPVLFLTHALALALFGFPGLGYRRFFAIFPLGALLFAQAALLQRKIDRTLVAAFTVGVVYIFVNPALHDTALSDSESVGFAYFLVGFAFLVLESRFRRWTDAAGAGFLACCALSKEPYGPVVVTTWMSVFLLRGGLRDFRGEGLRYLKFTTLGVAVVLVGLALYMVPTGSLKAYLAIVRIYPRLHRDPSHSICVQLGRYHPSTPMHDLAFAWDGVCKNFLTPTNIGMLLPLFAPALAYTARRSWALLAATGLGLVAALWAATASNCQWPHYYAMSLTGFYAFIAIGLDAMKGPFAAMDRPARVFIRLLAVVSVGLVAWPRYQAEKDVVHVTHPWGEPLPGIVEFIDKNSAPGDRIFTTGPPHLYVYANRLSALRESNVLDEVIDAYDGTTDEDKLRPLYDELVRHMPKIVVLDPERSDRKVRHMKWLVNPFLTAFHYRKARENVYVRP
jgi:hypothetical protein